jgi:hypothetical protein
MKKIIYALLCTFISTSIHALSVVFKVSPELCNYQLTIFVDGQRVYTIRPQEKTITVQLKKSSSMLWVHAKDLQSREYDINFLSKKKGTITIYSETQNDKNFLSLSSKEFKLDAAVIKEFYEEEELRYQN